MTAVPALSTELAAGAATGVAAPTAFALTSRTAWPAGASGPLSGAGGGGCDVQRGGSGVVGRAGEGTEAEQAAHDERRRRGGGEQRSGGGEPGVGRAAVLVPGHPCRSPEPPAYPANGGLTARLDG